MTQRRVTAQGDSIVDFLYRRAEEEISQFVDNLEYEYDPDKFKWSIDDLTKKPSVAGWLREYGLTPNLFINNTKPFYDYVKRYWEEEVGVSGDVNDEPLWKFQEEWHKNFLDGVEHFLKEEEVDEDAIEEIISELEYDSVMLAAFLCGEGWSCDWFSEVSEPIERIAGFEEEVTPEDLGLSGYSDDGMEAVLEASWGGTAEILEKLLFDYISDEYEEEEDMGHVKHDVEQFKDPRQQRLPLSAMAKRFARRFASTRRHANDLQLAFMEFQGGLKKLNSSKEKEDMILALQDVLDGGKALLDQLSK
jgi:hypothetical protein